MYRIAASLLFVCVNISAFGQAKKKTVVKKPVQQQAAVVTSSPSAETIRKNYINAVGGESAIASVKDIKLVYSATMQGMQISFTDWKSGGNMKREVSAMGNIVQKMVYANGSGKMEIQGQPKEMNAEQLYTARRDADIQAMLHPEAYGMKRTFVKTQKDSSGEVYVLDVKNDKGASGQEFYDAATGYLIRESHTTQGPQADLPVTVEYSDYREVPGVSGYKIPYTIKQSTGEQQFEAHVDSVEVNKGIAESEFK